MGTLFSNGPHIKTSQVISGNSKNILHLYKIRRKKKVQKLKKRKEKNILRKRVTDLP